MPRCDFDSLSSLSKQGGAPSRRLFRELEHVGLTFACSGTPFSFESIRRTSMGLQYKLHSQS